MTRKAFLFCSCILLIAAEDPANEASKKDLAKMQGDWAIATMIQDGAKLSDDEVQSIFRTVKGDQYTVFLFRKSVGKGTFKIDATKKPKTIDFVAAIGEQKQTLLGIYELEGDTYKICYAAAGKDRPKDFGCKKGSGHSLTIWEREKK
jgi:uncharacterized protein (TIGR03067 family)